MSFSYDIENTSLDNLKKDIEILKRKHTKLNNLIKEFITFYSCRFVDMRLIGVEIEISNLIAHMESRIIKLSEEIDKPEEVVNENTENAEESIKAVSGE